MTVLLPAQHQDPAVRERIVALIDGIAERLGRAWADFDAYRRDVPGRRLVLVDLTVDSWDNILNKLLIGKHLAALHGARLCGVLPGLAAVPYFTQQMCKAFGCSVFMGMAETFAETQGQVTDLDRRVTEAVRGWPAEGPDLRDRLSALRLGGLPVGDLVYDSYLRYNGCVTVGRMDQALLSVIADAVIRCELACRLYDRHEVVEVVTAHTVYNYFGILCREALARNIPVIQDLALNPVRLKRLSHFSMAREPLERIAPREVAAVLRRERAAAVAEGRDLMEARIGGRRSLSYNDALYGGFGSARRVYGKEELCSRLGWDPARPVVCILSHVFFESPHAAPGPLFHDVYDWLEATLDAAGRSPHIQWLLKPHPDQQFYDKDSAHSALRVTGDEAFERLLAPHRDRPNIRVCPDDLSNAALMNFAAAVVTMYGSAGYEFPSQGVPAVVASRAAYTGMGFTIEPGTREEYARTLADLHAAPPVSDEARDMAFVYAGLFLKRSRCASTLLAEHNNYGFWGPQYPVGMLEAVAERAERFEPGADPLFEAIRTMVRSDASTLNLPVF